jgi:hypothetical protein
MTTAAFAHVGRQAALIRGAGFLSARRDTAYNIPKRLA